jgi:hypothetical protein
LLDGLVTRTAGDGHYDYTGLASYGRLLSGFVDTAAMVSVRGLARDWNAASPEIPFSGAVRLVA